jgi:pimeloyl-ACP methyl ester carboxylesterase
MIEVTDSDAQSARRMTGRGDITALLGDGACPCLVLHCRGDRMQPVEQGRAFAAGLPSARFIAYDSSNHIPMESDPIWPLMERDILAFLSLHAK